MRSVMRLCVSPKKNYGQKFTSLDNPMGELYKHNDKNIQQKLTGHEFEFKESYWAAMETQLTAAPIATTQKSWLQKYGLVSAVSASILAVGLWWYAGSASDAVVQEENTAEVLSSPAPTKIKAQQVETTTTSQPLAIAEKVSENSTEEVELPTQGKTSTASKEQQVPKEKPKEANNTITNGYTTPPVETPPFERMLLPASFSNEALGTIPTPKEEIEQIPQAIENNQPMAAISNMEQLREEMQASKMLLGQLSTNNHRSYLPTFVTLDGDSLPHHLELETPSLWYAGASVGGVVKMHHVGGQSLTPVVGVFVGRHLSSETAIQAELQVKQINLADYQAKMQTEAMPSSVRLYDAKRLTFIEMPIVVKYNLHYNHQVQAGVKPAYLVAVGTDMDQSITTSDMGLSCVDLSAVLGYELTLSEQLSMELRYHIGLSNLGRSAEAKQREFYQTHNVTPSDNALAYEDNDFMLQPMEYMTGSQKAVRMQKRMTNSDVQLSLKYKF